MRFERSTLVFIMPYLIIMSCVRAISAALTEVPKRGSITVSLSAGLSPVNCRLASRVAASFALANCAPLMIARANLIAVARCFSTQGVSAMYWVQSQ